MQLGILYRTSEQFEEAENAFEYAKNAHGCENYQIAHTTAKNYMEWGLWSITNAPSQATHLFEQGTTKILEVLWTWTYPDAICFSAHSYIDMNIKYYSKLHMVPSRDTWLAMNACLDKYVNNANRVDRLLGDLFSNMCKFAKTNGLEIEHEQDVRRRLNQKVYDSTYVATEWSPLTNYLFMNNRYTHFKSGESIIVLSPDLKESSKYTQSLNSSILSQSSKDFLEMRIA